MKTSNRWIEINIDGLIGPTHHYGGLGVGNIASESNRHTPSSPRSAALEGLHKMELLDALGVPQFFLPPPIRPVWSWLESLGFDGERSSILRRCMENHPSVLSAAYSSAFMWTANAATVGVGSDTVDRCTHIKVANLSANLHRSVEASERRSQFSRLFASVHGCQVHPELFGCYPLRDEGAANVMRLSSDTGDGGIYLFVYGSDDHGFHSWQSRKRFPRQSKLASQLLSQSLKLPNNRCVFAEQTSAAIDAGVFHNDVISTSHENLLIYHEDAFEQEERVIEQLQNQFERIHSVKPLVIRIARNELPLSEAVATYFFNSQIVTQTDGTWRILCPSTCQNSLSVQSVMTRLKKEIPRISDFDYVPLHQSMANGGGPACLRLRVLVTPDQLRALPESARLNRDRSEQLRSIINREYPEQLVLEDLSRLDFAEHATETAIKLQKTWESTKASA